MRSSSVFQNCSFLGVQQASWHSSFGSITATFRITFPTSLLLALVPDQFGKLLVANMQDAVECSVNNELLVTDLQEDLVQQIFACLDVRTLCVAVKVSGFLASAFQ